LRETVTSVLCHVELRVQRGEESLPELAEPAMAESRQDHAFAEPERRGARGGARPVIASAGGFGSQTVPMGNSASGGGSGPGVDPRTPRNAPCPCGSGKKYKHCHGKV